MAFDFLDLFPDSEAAVVGSQGARDILENQYKQGMGAMEMERALMANVQAAKQMEEQRRLQPLAQTIQNLKLAQSVNLTGDKPYAGIDLNDMNQMNEFIKRKAAAGEIIPDMQADLKKAELTAFGAYNRAQLTSGVSRDNNQNTVDGQIRQEKMAASKKNADEIFEKYGKATLGTRKGRLAIGRILGHIASFGKDDLGTINLMTTYKYLLDSKEEVAKVRGQSPQQAIAAQAAPAPGTKPDPSGPKIFTYKGRKFNIKDGNIQEIK